MLTDARARQGALVELDPSEMAFIDAMTPQTSTSSTPPVEGDVDITPCDNGKFLRPSITPELTRKARAVFDSIVFKSDK